MNYLAFKGQSWPEMKQAAKVSRVDRDIPKSSLSHPQVILKLSSSYPQVTYLTQSDPI